MRSKLTRLRLLWLTPLLSMLIVAAAYSSTSQSESELRQLLQEAISSDAGFDDRFDAEVWLLDMSRRLEPFIEDLETRYGVSSVPPLDIVKQEDSRPNLGKG